MSLWIKRVHKNLVTVLNEEEVKNNCKIAKTEIDKKTFKLSAKIRTYKALQNSCKKWWMDKKIIHICF